MDEEYYCKNCKHHYTYFKQIKDEKGMVDFIMIPKCRLEHEILPDGRPADPSCFESKDK